MTLPAETFVIIGARGSSGSALRKAVDHALDAAGYEYIGAEDGYAQGGPSQRARRDVDGKGLCVGIPVEGDRAMAELSYPLALAPKLARDVAANLAAEVELFAIRVLDKEGAPLECRCDHLRVGFDGATTTGEFGDHLEGEFGASAEDPDGRWLDLCDGKAYFAIGALIDIVKRHFFEVPDMMPPSEAITGSVYRERVLGSPRLDDIARRARSADRAEIIAFQNQIGIRLEGPDGTKTTSFVNQDELDVLTRLFGPKLVDRRSP